MLAIKGTRTVDEIHRELVTCSGDNCGRRAQQSLSKALAEIPAIREEFWKNVLCLGENESRNQSLEKAGRVATSRVRRVMVLDALDATRVAADTPRGSTRRGRRGARDDEHYAYVAAWEFKVSTTSPSSTRNHWNFEFVHPSTRSYK